MSPPPAPKSGPRPRARSTASSARSAPAGRWPGSRWRCASAIRDVAIALADVPGAALYSFYTTGELKAEGTSITEGIGQGRITANLDGFTPEPQLFHPRRGKRRDHLRAAAEEGLNLGLSSGVNVAGAIRLARELGPGHTIVTMLCDPGTRYQSRLFNPEFMRSKGLPVPAWLERAAHHRTGFLAGRLHKRRAK